jgi:integrase
MGLYKRHGIRGETWCIRYKFNGRDVREAIGPSKREAENVLGKRKAAIREGRFFDVCKANRVSFRELAERYTKEHAAHHKAESTNASDHYRRLLLVKKFGERTLKQIDAGVVNAFLTRLREEGRSPATVNRIRALLSHMFTKGVHWGLCSSNPVRLVKALRENNRRVRYLMPDEVARLLGECPSWLRPIVLCAVHTGMRKEELLSLTWEQINPRERTIHLTRTKNGRTRTLPMNDELWRAFSALPRQLHSPYVFAKEDGSRYVKENIRGAFEAALRRARIEDFHFHDLRHTFASNLVMAGVDLLTVKELLGHQTMDMTVRYSHLAPSHTRGAVLALEKTLATGAATGEQTGAVPGA